MSEKQVDYSVYLVTERSYLNKLSLEDTIEEALKGGAGIVQLREKNMSTRDFWQLALDVKKITDQYRVPLLINDRLDIALAVEASGVHIGQEDMPVLVARKLLGPEKILGVSAGTLDEAFQAEQAGADYLGVGALFPTATKTDANPVSRSVLQQICSQVSIPVVGIGGINENTIGELKGTGIAGVAVVSAIMGKEDPKRATAHLKGIMGTINL